MNELADIIKELYLDDNIELNDIPNIDLYMDQVIQLFENKLGILKRNDEDKILTKTMINNYSKGKLLMPIKNKKYSKNHIVLMSLIYELKGMLSITDIKSVLDPLVEDEDRNKYNIEELYKSYLNLAKENVEDFKEESEKQYNNYILNNESFSEEERKILMICSLINKSNMYRRLAEKLIDNIENNHI